MLRTSAEHDDPRTRLQLLRPVALGVAQLLILVASSCANDHLHRKAVVLKVRDASRIALRLPRESGSGHRLQSFSWAIITIADHGLLVEPVLDFEAQPAGGYVCGHASMGSHEPRIRFRLVECHYILFWDSIRVYVNMI